jgi:putative FmdB family regulatory protein
MPTYEYACPQGHDFELFQKMSDKPRAKCPVCGKLAVRKISGGAGLHFKGSGFYITDYGKDGKGPRKDTAAGEAGKAGGAGDVGKAGKAGTAGDATPAAKTDAAAPAKSETGPAKKAKSSE